MKKTGLFILSIIFTTVFAFSQKAPSHHQWDQLVKKHVNKNGLVNYKGFKNDKAELDSYLQLLSNNGPQSSWSGNEQKAFWLNAYNAYTVSLIIGHYPLKSIKDIGAAIKIPFVNTPWDIKFITISGKKYDLNNIEHGILRKMGDPRVHFAINCASMSCPALRNEAYTATKLDTQLDDAGKNFLNDKSKNNISGDKADLSKIFSWFSGDFTKKGTLIDFLNKFSSTKMTDNTNISYKKYDWNLNEQQ